MPFIDTTSMLGGYGQQIVDWALGDDRSFSSNGLPCPGLVASDNILTDAYFTLKSAPNLPDANAIVQKHITTILTLAGQITGAPANILAINVRSADFEGLVFVGPVYYWDFRVITSGGHTYTIATGTVAYLQNTTQTNVAGTPATLPNLGLPRFRGFLPTHPKNIPNFVGIFNPGDYYRNSRPVSGGPSGWVCFVAGYDGSVFHTDGIIGNT